MEVPHGRFLGNLFIFCFVLFAVRLDYKKKIIIILKIFKKIMIIIILKILKKIIINIINYFFYYYINTRDGPLFPTAA